MAFDPSPIASIGDNADMTGAVSKGFQLKDLIDTNQLNQLKLAGAKRQEAEEQEVSKIFKQKGADLSTPEGASKLAGEVARVSPDKGMELLKFSQQAASGELAKQQAQLELYSAAHDFQAQKVGAIVASAGATTDTGALKYDAKTRDAMTIGAIAKETADIKDDPNMDPKLKEILLQSLGRFTSAKGPNGQPMPITFDRLNDVWKSMPQGTKQIKDALDALRTKGEIANQPLQAANLRGEQQHRKVEEQQGQERINIAKQNAGSFGGQIGDLMGALAERGVSVPAGMRSKAQQQALFQGLLSRNPGKSPDEIADMVKSGQLSLGAEKTEASVLGRREAAILPVEKSITKPGGFLDQAEKAVNAVDFPTLKAAGEFSNWGKEKESGPKLSAYKAAVAELRAEYSIVLSKGGQVTDAARHESAQVIPDLITKDQFQQIKKTVLQGIEASKGGVEESLTGVTGKDASTPSAPAQPSGAPAVGAVEQGYRYKGGDPSKKESWEKSGG